MHHLYNHEKWVIKRLDLTVLCFSLSVSDAKKHAWSLLEACAVELGKGNVPPILMDGLTEYGQKKNTLQIMKAGRKQYIERLWKELDERPNERLDDLLWSISDDKYTLEV